MNIDNEMWYDIPGYEGHYQVSNRSRVRSLKGLRDRILKPGKGYVGLRRDGVYTRFHVKQLCRDIITLRRGEVSSQQEGYDKTTQFYRMVRAVSSDNNKGKTSRYKGVSRCNKTGRWVSLISVYSADKKGGYKPDRKYLGIFASEEDAARAYNNALVALGYAPVNQVA